MGQNTEIAWTDATFNPWIGCSKVSDGCRNCYAEVDTFARRERARGLELWGPKAARHVTSESYWKQPLKWDREARAAGVRRRVFCASMADVFEDRPDLVEPRQRLSDLVLSTPSLDWLLLTKRPENAARLWLEAGVTNDAWSDNVWLGTTVEHQAAANKRIPHLLAVPARVRFLSCEPLIGEVRLDELVTDETHHYSALECDVDAGDDGEWEGRCVDWVIVGGESCVKARPFDVAWARRIVADCAAARVACFVNQLGANPCGPVGARDMGDGKKGGDVSRWSADLRVREFPTPRGR